MTSLYLQCIWAFALCIIGSAWYVFWLEPREAAKKKEWICKHPFATLVIFAALWTATLYGGSKSNLFTWGEYIQDAGTQNEPRSWVTNDLVHVEWYAPTLPSDDRVFVAYRENGTTNEWEDVAGLNWTVGQGSGEFTKANATNFQYFVYSMYIPPSPVVTNGVYHLSGFTDMQQEARFAPLKVAVMVTHTNGATHRIAPINSLYNGAGIAEIGATNGYFNLEPLYIKGNE